MPRRSRSLFSLAAALAVALALASPPGAGAGEAYYLLMFGSQRVPANPNYAHSFTTFVRVRWAGDGPCCAPFLLDAHTSSWLPANMKVRTGALCPEPGRNFELHTTLRYVLCNKERVSL